MPDDDFSAAHRAWEDALDEIEAWYRQIDGTGFIGRPVGWGPTARRFAEIPLPEHPLGSDPLTTAKTNAMDWPVRVANLRDVVDAIERIADLPTSRRHIRAYAATMKALGDDVERTVTELVADLKRLDELPKPHSSRMTWLNDVLEEWIGIGHGVTVLIGEAIETLRRLDSTIEDVGDE